MVSSGSKSRRPHHSEGCWYHGDFYLAFYGVSFPSASITHRLSSSPASRFYDILCTTTSLVSGHSALPSSVSYLRNSTSPSMTETQPSRYAISSISKTDLNQYLIYIGLIGKSTRARLVMHYSAKMRLATSPFSPVATTCLRTVLLASQWGRIETMRRPQDSKVSFPLRY